MPAALLSSRVLLFLILRPTARADPVVKTEADLQEDAALADSLNTALPGRHEDDREVDATQEDEEEDEEDEGEEEEQQDDDEEEVAPRQAQVAPPPQVGVVEQGDVISQCLASQARARRQVYKGAPAFAAAAIACVFQRVSSSSFPPPLDPPGGVDLFQYTPPSHPSGLVITGSLSDSVVPCLLGVYAWFPLLVACSDSREALGNR